MSNLMRKTFRRLTVGLTSAALVVSSIGVAAVGTAPTAWLRRCAPVPPQ